jgi:cell division protein FtsZ
VATGIDNLDPARQTQPAESSLTELAGRLRNDSRRIAGRIERSAPPPQFESPPALPAARHPEGRPANPGSEYARHAAPQGLDPYRRAAPARNLIEENVLDIPAFLRRKAN